VLQHAWLVFFGEKLLVVVVEEVEGLGKGVEED
jgi:hypothetical protein